MDLRRSMALSIAALTLAACGGSTQPKSTSADATRSEGTEAGILEMPFTAEQIRAEWIPGLTLQVRTRTPDGEFLERWVVVSADEAGAEIEFADLNDRGEVVGEPRVEFSSWTELRDHARFSAASTERQRVTRDTPLGRYDGWLYTTRDDDEETSSEFFFASALPGAPLYMKTTRGDDVLLEFEQLDRTRSPSE